MCIYNHNICIVSLFLLCLNFGDASAKYVLSLGACVASMFWWSCFDSRSMGPGEKLHLHSSAIHGWSANVHTSICPAYVHMSNKPYVSICVQHTWKPCQFAPKRYPIDPLAFNQQLHPGSKMTQLLRPIVQNFHQENVVQVQKIHLKPVNLCLQAFCNDKSAQLFTPNFCMRICAKLLCHQRIGGQWPCRVWFSIP